MKEEDLAKIAYAAVIKAIDDLRNDNSENGDYEGIGFPSTMEVNGNRFGFVRFTVRVIAALEQDANDH